MRCHGFGVRKASKSRRRKARPGITTLAANDRNPTADLSSWCEIDALFSRFSTVSRPDQLVRGKPGLHEAAVKLDSQEVCSGTYYVLRMIDCKAQLTADLVKLIRVRVCANMW